MALEPDSPFIQAMAIAGAVFWSIQIWLNFRRGHTVGLHQGTMLLWSLAGVPLGLHNILSHQHVALQVQAQILTGLSLVTWSQVMFYSHGWSFRRCVLALATAMLFAAAVQAAVIVGFTYGTDRGVAPHAFVAAMAILSAVGLSLGVLRHYLDIYTERTVRGISWGFVFLDAAGDLTSLLSIACTPNPDRLSIGIYASELALWTGMMLLGVAFYAAKKWRGSTEETAADGADDSRRTSQDTVHSVFSTVSASARRPTGQTSTPGLSGSTLIRRYIPRRYAASSGAVELAPCRAQAV